MRARGRESDRLIRSRTTAWPLPSRQVQASGNACRRLKTTRAPCRSIFFRLGIRSRLSIGREKRGEERRVLSNSLALYQVIASAGARAGCGLHINHAERWWQTVAAPRCRLQKLPLPMLAARARKLLRRRAQTRPRTNQAPVCLGRVRVRSRTTNERARSQRVRRRRQWRATRLLHAATFY